MGVTTQGITIANTYDSTPPPGELPLNDFNLRIDQPGVVWYHDFENEAEVDYFRWTGGSSWGNDPNDSHPTVANRGTVNWVSDGGIGGGGCLETLRKAGSNDGGNWWRPFSPFIGYGNGRGVDDPGANGTIPAQSWTPTASGDETANYDLHGWYGHESYQDAAFDGTDYWIQVRVKMDPNRNAEPIGGKLFYFTRNDKSLTSQELVTKSRHTGSAVGTPNVLKVYRSGSPSLPTEQANRESNDLFENTDGYWNWPLNEWVTVLYHVRNGLSGVATLFQMWVDHSGYDGGSSLNHFVKVWDEPAVPLPFDSSFSRT